MSAIKRISASALEQAINQAGQDARQRYSKKRLADCEKQLRQLASIEHFPDACIYATGSFARLEAGQYSDIDLFFLRNGPLTAARLNEVSFFADIIKVGERMKFPPFSNDGEYLRFISIDDMLKEMGGPDDDYHNHFTARMLLLLESYPLHNETLYKAALKKVVDAYFRDFSDHARDFRPIFLINDILRFWKTLCLNYENKRNTQENDALRRRRQQVRNFKLKFSRMLTCFGTVTAICALPRPVDPEAVIQLLQDPPLDRLLKAMDGRSELKETRQQILDLYRWFLGQTALPTQNINSLFESTRTKKDMFSRAEKFGGLVFRALQEVTKNTDYIRYLVI